MCASCVICVASTACLTTCKHCLPPHCLHELVASDHESPSLDGSPVCIWWKANRRALNSPLHKTTFCVRQIFLLFSPASSSVAPLLKLRKLDSLHWQAWNSCNANEVNGSVGIAFLVISGSQLSTKDTEHPVQARAPVNCRHVLPYGCCYHMWHSISGRLPRDLRSAHPSPSWFAAHHCHVLVWRQFVREPSFPIGAGSQGQCREFYAGKWHYQMCSDVTAYLPHFRPIP